MKKFIYGMSLALVAACGCVLYSCSDNDEPQEKPAEVTNSFSDEYFSIEDADYHSGALPTNEDGDPISGLSINSQGLTGGMNFATIQTTTEYKDFLVGVKGVDGYWQIDASKTLQGGSQATNASRAGVFTYIIPINFGVGFDSSIVIIIIAIDHDGNYTAPSENPIEHVTSEKGDLAINLTFSNEKDVDLHLYTPSGQHIYFGNRGGEYEENGETHLFGLDHDSNAACYIDGLNNENIVIPDALVEPGVYTVKVDMYSNCDAGVATNWAIVARYKGRAITPVEGKNPAYGEYPVGAGNGDHTFVMSFQVKEGEVENQYSLNSFNNGSFINGVKFTPLPLSEIAKMKIEEVTD